MSLVHRQGINHFRASPSVSLSLSLTTSLLLSLKIVSSFVLKLESKTLKFSNIYYMYLYRAIKILSENIIVFDSFGGNILLIQCISMHFILSRTIEILNKLCFYSTS